MEPKYVIALEVGSSKIRGAAGTVDAQGILTVLAMEEERLIDCVRYGWIRNVEEVSNRINRIIKKLDNRLHPRKVKSVYVAVGGLSFASSPREVNRRLPEEGEFTEELRADLRAEALRLPVGDREIADVTERRFFIDRNQVSQPVGVYGQDIKGEFNLVTCRPKARQMLARAITERLRISINDYIVRQVAEADLVLTPDEKQLGCVLVDFGAETTAISIYKQGYMQYFATLPLGSRNITIDITALNHLEERAEEYKKIGGNASADRMGSRITSDGVNYDEINNYVAARSGEIIANINEQIKYAELSPAQLPKGIVIVGAGAKLAGFNERLEQETKLPVRIGVPSAYIRIMDGRIQGADAVDVISILHAAATRGAKECMEMPAPAEEPAAAPQESAATRTATPEPEPQPEPRPEPKEKRRNIFGRVRDIATKFMSDEPYDDDFEDQ